MEKRRIFKLFLKDMERAPRRAIQTSFPKYTLAKNELVSTYSKLTGIPKEEFEDVIFRDMATRLGR
jgi:hypothetical protein